MDSTISKSRNKMHGDILPSACANLKLTASEMKGYCNISYAVKEGNIAIAQKWIRIFLSIKQHFYLAKMTLLIIANSTLEARMLPLNSPSEFMCRDLGFSFFPLIIDWLV